MPSYFIFRYKILFLDVLFPLDVRKIIFVDADQIVRNDMMELMEFDLSGAPYGYVLSRFSEFLTFFSHFSEKTCKLLKK